MDGSPGKTCKLDHRDAIDLDVERPGPFRNADEDARRRVLREIARVDRIDGGEMFGRGRIDGARLMSFAAIMLRR
jgi:hypothetical protein